MGTSYLPIFSFSLFISSFTFLSYPSGFRYPQTVEQFSFSHLKVPLYPFKIIFEHIYAYIYVEIYMHILQQNQFTTKSCPKSLSKTIPATCCLSKRQTTNNQIWLTYIMFNTAHITILSPEVRPVFYNRHILHQINT